jgi:hypothetical protein
LVYGGLESADLVGDENNVTFEEIVNNRARMMAKVIGNCQELGINMIFL